VAGWQRVAVLVSVLLETWAEGKLPTYFPRTAPLKAGTADLPGRHWSQYGAEEGVWRILGILERAGIPATVFSNALSAEVYPDLIRAIVKSGQHVAAPYAYAEQSIHPPSRRIADITGEPNGDLDARSVVAVGGARAALVKARDQLDDV
jgi:hypothetical protein